MESEEEAKKSDEGTAAERPLNRAERRALANQKGKSGAAGSGAHQNNGRPQGSLGRGSGSLGNVKLPRTGHK